MSAAAIQTVRLGEVLAQSDRAIASSDLPEVNLAGVYSFARGLFKRGPMRPADTSYKTYNRLVRDDFVISQPKAWEGALARVTDEFEGWFLSPVFPTFTADARRLLPAYLEWFCKRKAVWQDLQILSKGMGARRETVSPEQFLSLEIPLPPLDEQRRIVGRIDELAAKVEEARRLRRIAIEEGSALLPCHFGAKFRELADRHPVQPLGELSSHIVDGPHQTPTYLLDVNGGVPFVTVKNMVSGKLSFDNLNYVSQEDHREFSRRCRAERGDVLYSKDGATKGRPCYVDTDEEFSFFVSVALIKPLRDRLDGRYLVHLLNSSWIKDRMIDKSRGDMIPHIVLREIRAFPVPLPALDE